MPISSIQSKSDRKVTVRYNLTNDTTDNLRHIESIFSRIQSKLPGLFTFELRERDNVTWKYNIKQNGKKVGGVYVQFASKQFLIYDVIFFWDIKSPINFNLIHW